MFLNFGIVACAALPWSFDSILNQVRKQSAAEKNARRIGHYVGLFTCLEYFTLEVVSCTAPLINSVSVFGLPLCLAREFGGEWTGEWT